MQVVKEAIDPKDLDIVLADDLIDKDGNWYSHTLEDALKEQLRGKDLLWCKYVVDYTHGKSLKEFLGYTQDRVIFHIVGIGVMDILLDSLPRNPPQWDRFTI
jgi:hypothetical protein